MNPHQPRGPQDMQYNPNQFPQQFFQQQQYTQQFPQQYGIPPPQPHPQMNNPMLFSNQRPHAQEQPRQQPQAQNQQQQPRQQPQQPQPQRYQQQYHRNRDDDNIEADFYFPGAASLSDQLDKRVLVVLRDGKKLLGYLRSYDQFESTVERIVVGDQFGDLPLGLYMVRGENVVLMGEIDDEREKHQALTNISLPDILELQKQEREEAEEKLKKQHQDMRRKGLALDEDAMI